MNDSPLGFLLFLGFLAVVAFAAVFLYHFQKQANDSLHRAFQHQADRLGGVVSPSDWLTRPTLTFPHRGARVTVDTFSSDHRRHRKQFTRLRMPWPDWRLRMTVHPENPLETIGKFLGLHDIQIGSPHFDGLYMITGNNEQEIRRLLSPSVQQIIEALRRLDNNSQIHLSIMQGQLAVTVRGRIVDPTGLQRFISLCLELHDQALGAQDAGVQFIEPIDAALSPGAAEPICQVCGEAIVAELVHCKSCKTPHHQDCWQYYGACSTYGCRQTRSSFPARLTHAEEWPMNSGSSALGFITILALVVSVAVIIIGVQYMTNRALHGTYRRLAARFGGVTTWESMFERPVLTFRHQGGQLIVDTFITGKRNSREYVQLHCGWPDDRLRLAVYPEQILATIGKWIGMGDINIGWPDFDNRYTITGNDEQAIRAILSPPAQGVVESLRDLQWNNDIYISIRGGRLLVKKLGAIHDYDTLANFISLALRFYELAIVATHKRGVAT